MPTWFVNNNAASGGVHQQMDEVSPGADATTAPNYGWTVGIVGPALFSAALQGVKRTAATFAAGVQPDGTIITIAPGNCWRSTNPYSGVFDPGAWTFQMAVIAVANGGTQDGRAGFRLFHGPNADGTAAVEVTAASQVGTAVTNLTTVAQQASNVSPVLAGFPVVAEFIFVEVAWEITGVGTKAATDVVMRIGSTASLVTSTNFTPAAVAARGWLLRGCD